MPLEKSLNPTEKNIDIRQLIAHIKAFNSLQAEMKGNTIKLLIDESLPNYVLGNEVQLYQVLNKLVCNSIQTIHDGWITVGASLSSINHEEVNVLFAVSYTGNEP